MNKGDVIEIVTHEDGRLNIRRVQIDRVRRVAATCDESCGCDRSREHYSVVASNLKGKYPREYQLPIEPINNVRDPSLQNCTNWQPCDFAGVADP